eukprot:189936-Rhodomonas_salina.1
MQALNRRAVGPVKGGAGTKPATPFLIPLSPSPRPAKSNAHSLRPGTTFTEIVIDSAAFALASALPGRALASSLRSTAGPDLHFLAARKEEGGQEPRDSDGGWGGGG